MRPSVRLPLALSVSGLAFWLLFGFASTWWTAILALAAPLIALRCLPLSKGIPLALGNVLLGMIAAHLARTRGFADLPLETAAASAAVVGGVGLLARVVTTWRPRSGWLFVPSAMVVVDRALAVDLYRQLGMESSALSSWSHDLGAPFGMLMMGLLLEGLVNLASVGNRQFPDPYAQATRESGIRRSGLVGVVTVFVVVIGHFARDARPEAAPGNDVVVAICGAVLVALTLLAIVSWRRGVIR